MSDLSERQRDIISTMVHGHRANPDRFFFIMSDQGVHLMHSGVELEPISEGDFQQLKQRGYLKAERSNVEITQRGYDAVDSGFQLPDLEHEPELPAEQSDEGDQPLASTPADIDDADLAEAIEKLNHTLDDPDVPASEVFTTLARIFALLSQHPDSTPNVREYILDALSVVGLLYDEDLV